MIWHHLVEVVRWGATENAKHRRDTDRELRQKMIASALASSFGRGNTRAKQAGRFVYGIRRSLYIHSKY